MAPPQLLGPIKNKTNCLDKHKGLRDDRAGTGLKNNVCLLHEATSSRLGEVVVLSIVQKPTQRIKQNEEREEYIPNERTR